MLLPWFLTTLLTFLALLPAPATAQITSLFQEAICTQYGSFSTIENSTRVIIPCNVATQSVRLMDSSLPGAAKFVGLVAPANTFSQANVLAHFSNTTLTIVKYNNIANENLQFVVSSATDTIATPKFLKSNDATGISRMTSIRGTDLVIGVTVGTLGTRFLEVYE
jgi:hypothetical protein